MVVEALCGDVDYGAVDIDLAPQKPLLTRRNGDAGAYGIEALTAPRPTRNVV